MTVADAKHQASTCHAPSHDEATDAPDSENDDLQAPLLYKHNPFVCSTQQPTHVTLYVDVGVLFIRRLWRLLSLSKASGALLLALLSILEAYIMSSVGTVSGRFYSIFIDGQQSQLAQTMLWSAGLYAASAAFYSFKNCFKEYLAWKWRGSLSSYLQDLYYNTLAFYTLKVGGTQCAGPIMVCKYSLRQKLMSLWVLTLYKHVLECATRQVHGSGQRGRLQMYMSCQSYYFVFLPDMLLSSLCSWVCSHLPAPASNLR